MSEIGKDSYVDMTVKAARKSVINGDVTRGLEKLSVRTFPGELAYQVLAALVGMPVSSWTVRIILASSEFVSLK